MSYRPYYTNTQIDGQALNGAIKGIGSLFGKGKMTATQGTDASGRPMMNYSTSGGDFWDNVHGQQAQRANLAAQGLGFKTDMDLYQNQGGLNQQAKFNSGERLNSAADAETIFQNNARNSQEGLNSANPMLRARALEAINKLAEMQDQNKLFTTGLNYDKLANMARIPGAQLEGTEANTAGQRMQNASEFIKQGYLGEGLAADTALKKAHAQYYGIPRQGSNSLHFQPNAKGGGMVFDSNSGEVTFVDPEMATQYGTEFNNPATGFNMRLNPKQIPTGERSVKKIQTGVTRGGPTGIGGSPSPIPQSNTNKISGDKVSRALRILRGEE